jgi:hypothetical protein
MSFASMDDGAAIQHNQKDGMTKPNSSRKE